MQFNYAISFDANTFTVVEPKEAQVQPISLVWSDVRRVTVFKRDWVTTDCICIAVAVNDGTTIEMDEIMAGWKAFTEALPLYLPGSMPWNECFGHVAFPAFAPNE